MNAAGAKKRLAVFFCIKRRKLQEYFKKIQNGGLRRLTNGRLWCILSLVLGQNCPILLFCMSELSN